MPTALQHKRALTLLGKASKDLAKTHPHWKAPERALSVGLAQLVITRGVVRANTMSGWDVFEALAKYGLAAPGPRQGTFVATSVGYGFKPSDEDRRQAQDALEDPGMAKGKGSSIITAYHGGSHPIRKFSPEHGAQGVMWFTEDRDKILRGKSGALSTRYLMTVKLKVDKVAGWKEYDDLLLGQIFSKTYGFDAIRLDHGEDGADWVLRDPRRVEVVSVEERPAQGWNVSGAAHGHAESKDHVLRRLEMEKGLSRGRAGRAAPSFIVETYDAAGTKLGSKSFTSEASARRFERKWSIDHAGTGEFALLKA